MVALAIARTCCRVPHSLSAAAITHWLWTCGCTAKAAGTGCYPGTGEAATCSGGGASGGKPGGGGPSPYPGTPFVRAARFHRCTGPCGGIGVLRDAASSPTKELLIVPGAGHNDTYRVNPHLYESAVLDFLRQAVPLDASGRSSRTCSRGTMSRAP